MTSQAHIAVEVIYALPEHCFQSTLSISATTNVREAIEMSGVLSRHPEIALGGTHKVGIYGKVTTLETILRENDRVEIYRPLIADPKLARRKRAAQKTSSAADNAPAQEKPQS